MKSYDVANKKITESIVAAVDPIIVACKAVRSSSIKNIKDFDSNIQDPSFEAEMTNSMETMRTLNRRLLTFKASHSTITHTRNLIEKFSMSTSTGPQTENVDIFIDNSSNDNTEEEEWENVWSDEEIIS